MLGSGTPSIRIIIIEMCYLYRSTRRLMLRRAMSCKWPLTSLQQLTDMNPLHEASTRLPVYYVIAVEYYKQGPYKCDEAIRISFTVHTDGTTCSENALARLTALGRQGVRIHLR